MWVSFLPLFLATIMVIWNQSNQYSMRRRVKEAYVKGYDEAIQDAQAEWVHSVDNMAKGAVRDLIHGVPLSITTVVDRKKNRSEISMPALSIQILISGFRVHRYFLPEVKPGRVDTRRVP